MSSSSSPCAACKIQRRKCTQECVFAPYFPPDQPTKFANVHRVFGASNVAKLLNELSAAQREDAVNSLHFEAEQRIADPVYGCVGSICLLQQRLRHLQGDLETARHELSQYIGPQAFNPIVRPAAPVPPHNAAAAYGLISGGARQAYLQPPPPPAQALQHGMFPMMRVGSGGLPLVIGETRQHQALQPQQPPQQQQLLPLQAQQQQQVYEVQQLAALAAAQQQQEMYATYEQMQQQQQQLLRLYGQGQQQQQHLQQQELVRFNSAGGYEASSSGNAHHGFLNQIPVGGGGGDSGGGAACVTSPGLALGNYDQVQAYHMQQQVAEQQQPQQLGDQLGINLNQQEQHVNQLGDLGLNLNQQNQDVNQLEAHMFLEPLGPPQSLQQQLGHRRSKSDHGFDPADDC